jgi:hypothetical protein
VGKRRQKERDSVYVTVHDSPTIMSVFPLELINEIVLYLVEPPSGDIYSEYPGSRTKPDWSDINGLSLVSHSVRSLTLQAWFRILCVSVPEDIVYGQYIFPKIKTLWTR